MRRSMDIRMLPVYFAIGGAVIAAVTYFGSRARGELAAFIAFLPTISAITLCTIYANGGTEKAVSYTKSMILLLPPWLLYAAGIIFLLPRIGLVGTLVISIAAYMVSAFLIMKFV
jgi:uncharacterized membrane protein (GlpM family)